MTNYLLVLHLCLFAGLISCVDDGGSNNLGSNASHLLINEIVYNPTDAQFIEIYNPTAESIELNNYYVADYWYNVHNLGFSNYYYSITSSFSASDRVASESDFAVRLNGDDRVPTVLNPGEYFVLVMSGEDFEGYYGDPTGFGLSANENFFEVELDGDDDGTIDLEVIDEGSSPSLFREGEPVVLYYWDGESDLVFDVDIYWPGGDQNRVDKTGKNIDGRDENEKRSFYQPDRNSWTAPPALEGSVIHPEGYSLARRFPYEALESWEGETNGLTVDGIDSPGHDETTEDLAQAFGWGIPTPGSSNIETELSELTPDQENEE